jgi:long-chain acyl-CoA synthetase
MNPSMARLLAPYRDVGADHTALVHAGRRWSYPELAAATDAVAAAMAEDGLAGERVALFLPNCPEAVLTYLACFASGATAAPLNSRYAPPELERALRRARPRWIVVHVDHLDRLHDVEPDVLAPARILVIGEAGTHEPFAALLATPARATLPGSPDQPAVMFFTSGSTGQPKAVVHTQASALAMLTSTREALGDVRAGDLVQVFEPLVHVSGFIATLTTLLAGGTVALYDRFDVDTYLAALLEHRPTLVCTHIDVLAQLIEAPGASPDAFASLRGIYTGGDTVPARLQKDFLDLAGLPIGVGWGMTEAIWLTVAREPHLERDGCIGTPVGGAEIRSDPHTGELLVRGPMVMREYWEDPELTEATLADGWLHTGDTGRQDASGTWWFTGRLKDIIVRRTSKITPGEVEAALDAHPDVAMSAVVAVPDPDEGQVPVAFVVPHHGRTVDAQQLVVFLRERIAGYKIPARIHVRDALPLTPSGKISHRELREPDPAGH